MNFVDLLVAERLSLLLLDSADEMTVRVKPAIRHRELPISGLQIPDSFRAQTGRSTAGAHSPLPQRCAFETDDADQHRDHAQEHLRTGEVFVVMHKVLLCLLLTELSILGQVFEKVDGGDTRIC